MSGIALALSVVGGFFPLTMSVGLHSVPRPGINFYGYQQSVTGTLAPSTNNFPPNAAQTITQLYYVDSSNTYVLTLATTAVNSGWVSITINGLTLNRTSATYSSAGWSWTAPDSGAALTGAVGTNVKIIFA